MLTLRSTAPRLVACWANPADRHAVERMISRLEPEAGEASSPALDAAVMAALGWQLRVEHRTRHAAWRCRSPWACHWQAVPRVSGSVDAVVQHVVPHRWDHSSGVRHGHPFGWVKLSDAVWFETSGSTPARALLKAALFGQRHLLLEAERRG
jgi:hypothetical protein